MRVGPPPNATFYRRNEMDHNKPPSRAEQHVASTSVGSPGESSARRAENRSSYVVAARELSRFRLGEQRVDVRGWPVFADDGPLVGAIDRLMVEPLTCKIRYVVVALIRAATSDSGARPGSVLVPVGVVRRLDDRQAVVLDGVTTGQLASAPRLENRAVTRAEEDATLAAYGMPNSLHLKPTDFYRHPNFDESRLSIAVG